MRMNTTTDNLTDVFYSDHARCNVINTVESSVVTTGLYTLKASWKVRRVPRYLIFTSVSIKIDCKYTAGILPVYELLVTSLFEAVCFIVTHIATQCEIPTRIPAGEFLGGSSNQRSYSYTATVLLWWTSKMADDEDDYQLESPPQLSSWTSSSASAGMSV